MQNLVNLFIEAQTGFSYLIERGYPSEELQGQKSFLRGAKVRVEDWNNLSSATGGEYQTSPNSSMMFRQVPGYDALQLAYLGSDHSPVFPGDEDDSEGDSNDSDIEAYDTEDEE